MKRISVIIILSLFSISAGVLFYFYIWPIPVTPTVFYLSEKEYSPDTSKIIEVADRHLISAWGYEIFELAQKQNQNIIIVDQKDRWIVFYVVKGNGDVIKNPLGKRTHFPYGNFSIAVGKDSLKVVSPKKGDLFYSPMVYPIPGHQKINRSWYKIEREKFKALGKPFGTLGKVTDTEDNTNDPQN